MKINIGAGFANLLISPRSFLKQLFFPLKASKLDQKEALDVLNWLGSVQEDLTLNKTVLFVSLQPLPYNLKIEAVLARALRLKGYRVIVLTNLACNQVVQTYHAPQSGVQVILLENFISLYSSLNARKLSKLLLQRQDDLLIKIKEFKYRESFTGIHSLATLSASMTSGGNPLDKDNVKKLRKIIAKSISYSDCASSILEDIRPDLVIGVEKGFVGTSEIFYEALGKKIDYVQWVGCHEPDSIMLKRYNSENCREHPFSLSEKSWQTIRSSAFDSQATNSIMDEFKRGYSEGAWFRYKNLTSNQEQTESDILRKRLGLDSGKKTAVIYSHILNDANLFYGRDIFVGGFKEWLIETVRVAAENPSVNWVLKLHPANVYRNAKLGYTGKYGELVALEEAFGKVPDFLFIVYPEEKTSPLSFFRITDVGITVRGTVGLELPCFGVPVLTAGTGRYAGKGFTIDSTTKDEYLNKIREINKIPSLTKEQQALSQKYAYAVFRMRPAHYDKIFRDIYDYPVSHPRYRDISLFARTFQEVVQDDQMSTIISFLESDDEDFLNCKINYA